ncbi:MAG: hypothetical protein IT448_08710 [Phycisphaerales bacterium]|nr:hypothetical protein [Phycisphaerales bacterium]
MSRNLRTFIFALIVVLGLTWSCLAVEPTTEVEAHDALKSYVERPDDSYGWTVRQRTRLGQSDCIELTLTSQTWEQIVWKHRLFLIVPDGVQGQTDALLVIEGGRWKDSYAEPLNTNEPAYPKEAILFASFAEQLHAPLAIVLNVPQQPVFGGKTEDAIIAYTFDEYLKTGQSDWPLLLPMVKSAVRAMDAVQAFAKSDRDLTVNRFTVTGASKRGWTTWLTAAVERRVMALAPMVIDMLNLPLQLPHQYRSLGEFPDRIHDYTAIDLPKRIDSPRGRALVQIVDPYRYRDDLTQPKLILLGTNDGYWTLDALNLYWDGLEGQKYVLYVPNADHDLAMDWRRILGGIRALHRHATGEQPLPQLNWHYDQTAEGLTLTVDPGQAVSQVLVWSAQAPTRDFREAKWSSQPLAADEAGRYIEKIQPSTSGYRAVFAEIAYPGQVLPLRLSTTIRIVGNDPQDAGDK